MAQNSVLSVHLIQENFFGGQFFQSADFNIFGVTGHIEGHGIVAVRSPA